MPSFDFDATRRERLNGLDPVTFKLGGKTFKCRRSIPFETLLRTVATDAQLPVADLYRYECQFVADCLEPGQEKTWEAVLTSVADPVGEPDVEGVVRFLVNVYAARPTSPSSGSSAGRQTTGTRSSSTRTKRSPAKKRAA